MATAEVKAVSNCKKELKITIPAEDVDSIRQEQVKVVRKEVSVSGFRKGKAPVHMVKKKYAATIEQYTIDEAMQSAVSEILQKENINPVDTPVLKNFNLDDKKNLVMEVEVEINPEIELKKYKGLKFEKQIYKITDEDVKRQLNYLQKSHATITAVDDKAENGHWVTLTMQELDESGMPLIGKKYDDIRFQLGEGQFDKDIEKQIYGLFKGDERKIEKTYPANVAQNQPTRKTERYKITVEKIEQEELPQLNDEFVKDLNLEIDNVEQLKERVKHELEHKFGEESEHRFYNQVAHELLQQNPFDVPESIVNRYLDKIVEEMRHKDKKIDEKNVRENYRADAVFNIKWYHLKQKIADQEKISANENDYKKFVEDIKDEKIRKFYETNTEIKNRVINDLFERKIFDFLIENSTVKTREEKINKRKELEAV